MEISFNLTTWQVLEKDCMTELSPPWEKGANLLYHMPVSHGPSSASRDTEVGISAT